MIRNGYYIPVEVFEKLPHFDDDGNYVYGDKVAGQALVLSNRSAGKTVNFGLWFFDNFRKHGVTYVLLARNDKMMDRKYLRNWWSKIYDLQHSRDEWAQELLDDIHSREIEVTRDSVIIDGEPFIYCVALSMSNQLKDTFKPKNVHLMVMDEAIYPYEAHCDIYGEPAMMHIWKILQTAARGDEDAKARIGVLFLANVTDRDNWIFDDWDFLRFWKSDTKKAFAEGHYAELVINHVANDEWEGTAIFDAMKNSKTGRQYIEANMENRFTDNLSFIVAKPLDFNSLRLQIVTKSGIVGIFKQDDGTFHISIVKPSDKSKKIVTDVADSSPGVSYEPRNSIVEIVRLAVGSGRVTFHNLKSKNVAMNAIGLIRN